MKRWLPALVLVTLAVAHAARAQPADPWSRLPQSYQSDLRAPLNNLRFYPWLAKPYGEWWKRWFGGAAAAAGKPEDHFHAYYFNEVLSAADRQSLVLVYAKLRRENHWSIVRTVKWAGAGVAMLFEPSMSQPDLRRWLAHNGYGDWWLASKGNPWGVRSRFGGPELHFRGGDFVNVHIDLNNPGDPRVGTPTSFLSELSQAFRHFNDDLRNRDTTHTNDKVRARLAAFGLVVPLVD